MEYMSMYMYLYVYVNKLISHLQIGDINNCNCITVNLSEAFDPKTTHPFSPQL